jgi:hypothetical protein
MDAWHWRQIRCRRRDGLNARFLVVNRLPKMTRYRRPILTHPMEQAASERAP